MGYVGEVASGEARSGDPKSRGDIPFERHGDSVGTLCGNVPSLTATLALSLVKDKDGGTRLAERCNEVNRVAEPGENCGGTENGRG